MSAWRLVSPRHEPDPPLATLAASGSLTCTPPASPPPTTHASRSQCSLARGSLSSSSTPGVVWYVAAMPRRGARERSGPASRTRCLTGGWGVGIAAGTSAGEGTVVFEEGAGEAIAGRCRGCWSFSQGAKLGTASCDSAVQLERRQRPSQILARGTWNKRTATSLNTAAFLRTCRLSHCLPDPLRPRRRISSMSARD